MVQSETINGPVWNQKWPRVWTSWNHKREYLSRRPLKAQKAQRITLRKYFVLLVSKTENKKLKQRPTSGKQHFDFGEMKKNSEKKSHSAEKPHVGPFATIYPCNMILDTF